MGKFMKLEIRELADCLLIGKEIRHSMEEQMKGNNPLPALWDKCFADGAFSALEAQADYIYDDGYVGVMLDWDKGDGNFSYVVGMLMKPGASVPDGYFSRQIEASKVAVGWIQGKDAADACSIAHEATEKALKAEGHTCNNMKWCMELYNCPRFTTPDENGNIILDYLIPID